MVELPKHGPELSKHEETAKKPDRGRARAAWLGEYWLWGVLVLLGAAFMLAPIRLGMYSESAEGQRMVERFTPVLTDQRLHQLENHLAVIEAARAETAERRLPHDDLSHSNTISFVAQFPETEARFSSWIATMRADEGAFGQLRSLPPFGLFPFVFGFAGLALVVIGMTGLFSASARTRTALRSAAALVGVLLVLFPVTAGVFAHSSAGTKLLRDFRPILTEENVRWAQSEFVVIGPSSAELLNDLHTHPGANLPATKAFVDQWATISADFANVIEEFADNLGHFQALERLNETTKPLGLDAFDEFGWFYLVPGLALVLVVGADVLLSRNRNNAQEQV
ncbi:conserved hypothetical protein [Segniliparus rotundus DSM 44985]|uniref:Uncharacterized protein n=1 Tax=Segniliparus rotundus (strain ATCC BAA-972 / CDC 1076 / CIP 108378 / DSM 44985 / JCM 13578) TaxID=640132 RepID=D6ZB58_SEGRD|nr:hypothetical protein [Segniliparus rotundus]ADG96817.1 conserved hypothetical protein [Segniliparus rotundus DSM 44985]